MFKLPATLTDNAQFKADCTAFFAAAQRVIAPELTQGADPTPLKTERRTQSWDFMQNASIRDLYLCVEKHICDSLSPQSTISESIEDILTDIASWPMSVEHKVAQLQKDLKIDLKINGKLLTQVASFKAKSGGSIRVRFGFGFMSSLSSSESVRLNREWIEREREDSPVSVDRRALIDQGLAEQPNTLIYVQRSSGCSRESIEQITEIGNIGTSLARLAFLRDPASRTLIPPVGAVEALFIDSREVTNFAVQCSSDDVGRLFGFPRSSYQLDDRMVSILEALAETASSLDVHTAPRVLVGLRLMTLARQSSDPLVRSMFFRRSAELLAPADYDNEEGKLWSFLSSSMCVVGSYANKIAEELFSLDQKLHEYSCGVPSITVRQDVNRFQHLVEHAYSDRLAKYLPSKS